MSTVCSVKHEAFLAPAAVALVCDPSFPCCSLALQLIQAKLAWYLGKPTVGGLSERLLRKLALHRDGGAVQTHRTKRVSE